MPLTKGHEHWSSRLAFLMATVGSAVGLGNIWRFPYSAGMNGGGAYVLVYIAAVLLLAMPVLITELMLGRRGQMSPPASMGKLAAEIKASPKWKGMGYAGLFTALCILSFYSVIGGWALAYIPKLGSGVFNNAAAESITGAFGNLVANPWTLLFWHSLFMAITVWISLGGIRGGIEKSVNILMPALFIMLLIMVTYAAITGDFGAALNFLFNPDFSKITGAVVLDALGQAFFSIGAGMAILMAYGSYLGRDVNIPRAALIVATADTTVALLAGLAIFPIVFANGLAPDSGPGLVFQTLPLAFSQMPGGIIFGTLFFILLSSAAITSSISLLEPIVEWLDETFAIQRKTAALIAGLSAWTLGIMTILSFNLLSGYHPLEMFDRFAGKTFFDLIDAFTNNLMLPLGGLLMAIFAGWLMNKAITSEELGLSTDHLWYRTWRFLMRYLAPLVLLVIFLTNIL